MTAANSITSATKVNLGILGTMLVATATSVLYLSSLNSSVDNLSRNLDQVKAAIDRNTMQLATDSRALAVLETIVGTIDRRVIALEADRKVDK